MEVERVAVAITAFSLQRTVVSCQAAVVSAGAFAGWLCADIEMVRTRGGAGGKGGDGAWFGAEFALETSQEAGVFGQKTLVFRGFSSALSSSIRLRRVAITS
jgi:hypothetical protein